MTSQSQICQKYPRNQNRRNPFLSPPSNNMKFLNRLYVLYSEIFMEFFSSTPLSMKPTINSFSTVSTYLHN